MFRSIFFSLLLTVGVGTALSAQTTYDEAGMRALATLQPKPIVSSYATPTWQQADHAAKRDETGKVLLISGAALIVVGAVVGDDGGTALIVGGIGIGAYGFYLYTR